MFPRPHRFRFFEPSSNSTCVLGLGLAFALATALAQWLSGTPAWRVDSPVQLQSDAAVAVGLGLALVQAVVQRHRADLRRAWLRAGAAMLLLAAVLATDWLADLGHIEDNWLIAQPLWLLAAGLLHATARRSPARRLWQLGLAFQLAFALVDFGDGRLVSNGLGTQATLSLEEWTELLAIDAYVLALALAGLASPLRSATVRTGQIPALGTRARQLFATGHFAGRAKYPPLRLAFAPSIRPLLLVLVSLWLVATVGPLARRASGRSLRAQLSDLLVLCVRGNFDPLSYYQQELYRAGGRADAAHYLTRLETKNGLLRALNTMREQPHAAREMGDKLLFEACCRQAGLAAAPVLLACGPEGLKWRAARGALDRDLLCKPRHGRGARGVLVFRHVARETYRAPNGDTVRLDALLERLVALGRAAPVIVQPRLRNHADIADLAEQSLVTIRVLTCLDADGRPIATHGVLRILAKLEPRWPLNDELGVPIDPHSGRLGWLASDRLARCAFRYAYHPVSGQRVEGRVLAAWQAVAALAVAAHRAFAHRVLIGWDIALTEDGPLLLEGNANPDVMFVQRAYGEGFGRSALGPLLESHLAALARTRGLD